MTPERRAEIEAIAYTQFNDAPWYYTNIIRELLAEIDRLETIAFRSQLFQVMVDSGARIAALEQPEQEVRHLDERPHAEDHDGNG